MKFRLFSVVSFEVPNPIALIECYCFQSDFYANYDLIPIEKRKVEHVNKIGARIRKNLLPTCKNIIEEATDLKIFDYDLDEFLDDLDNETRNNYILELNQKVLRELLKISGIGLSKATKILHTLHPDIIPIIDNQLREEYRKINRKWKEGGSEIFIDYYNNLKERDNRENLKEIFSMLSEKNLRGLTKVRIFDILWWSYLKAKRLKKQENIKWSSIQW